MLMSEFRAIRSLQRHPVALVGLPGSHVSMEFNSKGVKFQADCLYLNTSIINAYAYRHKICIALLHEHLCVYLHLTCLSSCLPVWRIQRVCPQPRRRFVDVIIHRRVKCGNAQHLYTKVATTCLARAAASDGSAVALPL